MAAPAVESIASLASSGPRPAIEDEAASRREPYPAPLVDVWLQDTSHLSTEQVLRDLVERLAVATRAPIVEIYTVEADTARALVSYDGGQWDTAWEDVVLRLARYPSSLRAVETGDVVLVSSLDDATLDRQGRFSMERWGYQSHLSLPLIVGGRTLGLLELYDYVPRDFSSDVDLVRGVGRLAALALDNERLAKQMRRRSRMVAELEAVASLCASAPGIETLADSVAQRLLEALDTASCQVFRSSSKGAVCIASHDRSGRDDQAIGLLTDLSDFPTVVHTMNVRDVLAISSLDDERLTDAERAAYRAGGWSSEVCVPLVMNDELRGFIDLLDSRPRAFAEYAGFLRSVASMVSVAFEATRLREDVARGRDDVGSLTAIAALDAPADPQGEVLESLAAEIRSRLGAADCDIFALDQERLRCLVSVDERGRDDSVSTRPLDIDRFPATAQAVRSGELVVVPDLDDPRLSDQERSDMAAWGFRSEACLPLVSQGRVVGLVDVFDDRPRDFAEHRTYLAAAGRIATRLVRAVLAARGS
jgi:GAF domain-containing protein